MLPITLLQLLLGIALLGVFMVGSDELRQVLFFFLLWATGLYTVVGFHVVGYRPDHYRLASRLTRVYTIFVVVSLVALAVTNSLFYYNTIGRALDLFFDRDPCDPDVPGSGFVDTIDYWWWRNSAEILDFLHFLRSLIYCFLFLTLTPIVIALGHWAHKELKKLTLTAAIIWLDEHPGESLPPWMRSPMPPPKPEPEPLPEYSHRPRKLFV